MFFEGKARAAREQRRLVAWHAWNSGILSQSTKPPTLEDFMGPAEDAEPEPPRKKSGDELWAIAQAWNEKLRGKVIYRDSD